MASKSRKHSIYTHFPKDRNCEVCFQTKMTRAPCRRRTGEALLRTKKFGDLMTADGQGDGSPRQVSNKRRRTREGPKPACVQTPLSPGWHTQGREGRIDVLPWYCLVGVVSTSSETHRREERAARKGKWSPRRTGMAVLTFLGMRPGNKNGQNSGDAAAN